ncbi:MAG: hypothetical protein K2F61_06735, partial [Muribaculaceae bacterium]|nr:hypothetical protein [Muribaculaceae bacterium]
MSMLWSCSDTQNEVTVDDPVRYSVVMKGMSFSDESSEDEGLSEVTVFQFGDGVLYKEECVSPDNEGRTDMFVVGDTRMYCVANASLDAQEKVTQESDFSKSGISSVDGENSAPCFLSA